MSDKSALLGVNIGTVESAAKYRQTGVEVLLDGGESTRATTLNIHVLERLAGRTIPKIPYCPSSFAEALKFYAGQLGGASVAAQDAFKNAANAIADADQTLQDALSTVDTLLSANPDPNSPKSLKELNEAINLLEPTVDVESLEVRVASQLGVNVVNGVLFPRGSVDLCPARSLARDLELDPNNPDLSHLTGDCFVMVLTQSETIERARRNSCGRDVVEYEVVDRKVGVNIPAGPDHNIKLYWFDQICNDTSTQLRLKALGLTAEELGAALTNRSAGRLSSAIVDTSILDGLRGRLDDGEIAKLLTRGDDACSINMDPTGDDIVNEVLSLLRTNTGRNQNQAGTNNITDNMGRGGDPTMLLLGLVKWTRSMGIVRQGGVIRLNEGGGAGGFVFDPNQGSQEISEDCFDVMLAITEAIDALEGLVVQANSFFRELYGRMGLGTHQLNVGLDVATCLGSFGLGFDANLGLAIGLPFQIELFLAAFGALIVAVVSLASAIKALLCIPQGLVQLLFGGICGFKPFDFNVCPPDLGLLVNRLVALINLVSTLISKVVGSVQTMRADLATALRLSNNLKFFSTCALAVMPIGVYLGLTDLGQLRPTSATVNVGIQSFGEDGGGALTIDQDGTVST